ncbi:hypothetical protein IAT38_000180 [Cryptococcus sp. DSM 104549]
MSDQQPPSDPGAIVQQLQALDNIEEDLVDTAQAVATSNADDAGAQAQEQLLDSAETMESVLEAAIPPAPAPAPAPVPSSEESVEQPTPAREDIPVAAHVDATPDAPAVAETPVVDEASNLASEATNLLNSVGKDLGQENQAVEQPEAQVPQQEESTEEDIVIDEEEPTTENIVEAATNLENQGGPSTSAQAQGEGLVAPQPTPTIAPPTSTPTPQSEHVSQPSQTQPQHPEPLQSDVPLPEGLTERSPSVGANRDLVAQWQSDQQNAQAILGLFDWSVQKGEIHDARVWYDVLAVDNPTATQPLLGLINLELALNNFPQVESLFAKALKGPSGGITASADVSVWTAYLHYIRRQNPVPEGTSSVESVRSTITKAYEFALNECGVDKESGGIWDEYIKFVASGPSSNQWEVQAKQDALRKVYQRAVCIPLNNIEALWKAYDAFETSISKLTAKKFLAERSPAYMTARTALRELRALTDKLPRAVLPPKPSFTDKDRAMVNAWKAVLSWEEGNPLVIQDQAVLEARIGYALRKFLGEMRHFPEAWHHASTYYSKNGKPEEAAETLKAGIEACPKSFLLTFSFTEVEEGRKNYAACHQLYTALIDRLNPEVDDLRKKIAVEVEIARGPPIPGADTAVAGGDVDMNGNETSEAQKLAEEREARGRLVAERRGKDVEQAMVGISMVWIMYMRFARRAEGIKASRGVFGKARKSPHLTWHTFEASAMIEYHSNKDSGVAIRIFELGFKLFSEEVDYVTSYLQFLLSINDDNNARALFERSALKIPAEKSRPLWDAWARYEYTYGDLAAVQKFETRLAEVFPNDSPLKRFAQRFTYHGIDQVAIRDLGFGRRPTPGPIPTGPAVNIPTGPAAGVDPISSGGTPINSNEYKRPAPDSPRGRRPSVEGPSRSRSPKRQRGASPRRFPPQGPAIVDRERDMRDPRDRPPPGRFAPAPGLAGPGGVGGRSPMPIGAPQQGMPMAGPGRRPLTPVQQGIMPAGGPVPAYLELDRSGVGKPLAWFMAQLPTARSFDGPVFRSDDIVGLFSTISADGAGSHRGPGPAYDDRRGFDPRDRDDRDMHRDVGPPPMGYNGPVRGRGGAPRGRGGRRY